MCIFPWRTTACNRESAGWNPTGRYVETTGINPVSLLGRTTAQFNLLTRRFFTAQQQKPSWNIYQGNLKHRRNAWRWRPRQRWRHVHRNAWIIFRVRCLFLPYCEMKQDGQATERGSICRPFSLLSASRVTSSSLGPPAWFEA